MKVVIGFDGSEASARAFEVACRLSGPDGQLWLVAAHITRDRIPESDEQILRDELLVELSEIAKRGSETTIETIVRDGHPQTVLVEVASEVGAEVIVVGRSGRSGLLASLLGSVSSGLVTDSPLPTLVVP